MTRRLTPADRLAWAQALESVGLHGRAAEHRSIAYAEQRAQRTQDDLEETR